MFYFDEYCGQKILKSSYLKNVTAFFTLRNWDTNCLPENTAIPEQIHGDNIELVDSRILYPNTDGLILKDKNRFIRLKFADCVPLIFYDKVKNTGAIAHAGWRGTASKIGAKTIQKMESNPADIVAVIGPAIGLCCYEVSEDVKEKLLSTVNDNDNLYIDRKVDLKGINARQLKELGVENIDICPYCTSCNNDLFYSYRKENGTKDRHYAVLCLS